MCLIKYRVVANKKSSVVGSFDGFSNDIYFMCALKDIFAGSIADGALADAI